MKKFSMTDLMQRLSIIPGLGFLYDWLVEARGTKTRFNQRVGDLTNYYNTAKGVGGDISGAASGEGDEDTNPDDDYADGGSQEDSDYY